MEPARLIAGLREGIAPDAADLRAFAAGLADGSVSDAQGGAFAMAVCLRGLGEAGRVALTEAMRDSGAVLRWDLPGPVLDKHSTGGVGDCVSLLLAPALAACGMFVPMISGRGLGHTGGTLDKLEAIPGLTTAQDPARFRRIVRELGCAIVSASAEIAPADRRLYGIRDVTGTVESIDLITASILSKKLAAGLEGLVLDVKCGSGAFMKTAEDAAALARALVTTATGAGCPTSALITDMSQPLAPALGNGLEVAETMAVLTGEKAGRLRDLTVALGAALLAGAGIADGAARLIRALDSGAAAERFAAMVHAMGGPPDMAEDWRSHLPRAKIEHIVLAERSGTISAIDGASLGHAVVALGGGRRVETDRINPAVGLSECLPLGAQIAPDTPLARIHAASDVAAEKAAMAVRAAYRIGAAADIPPLILDEVM